MGAIYTVDQTLQVNDYYAKVVKAKAFKNIFQTLIKVGEKPRQWKQEVEVEDATKAFDISAAEGQDFDETGLTGRTNGYLENQLQKFRTIRGFKVTDETALLPGYTEQHGEAQLARQIRQDSEECAFSIDCAIGSFQEAVARGTGKGATDIARTRGMGCWLTKGEAHTASGMAIPEYLRPGCGLTGNVKLLTEAALKEQLIKATLECGDDNLTLTALVGLKLKALMSNWLGVAEQVTGLTNVIRRTEPKSRTVELICDEFRYDGVSFKALVCNHVGCTMPSEVGGAITIGENQHFSGYFFRPEFWDRGVLMPMTIKKLENRGGGERGYHEAILRLTCRNPLGQFVLKHTGSESGSTLV